MQGPLTWRPLTPGDARASADLLNAMEAVDQVGEHYTADDTLAELIEPYADLARASLGVFDGAVLTGFMKIRFKPPAGAVHRVFLDGGVRPAYRRRGIGTALVTAGLAAAKAGRRPGLKLAVDVHKAEHIAGVAELLGAQGFSPVRYFQGLTCPLGATRPEGRIPGGLALEPWTPETDHEFLATRNTAYGDRWDAFPVSPSAWRAKFAGHAFRPATSFLARETTTGTPAGLLVTLSWAGDTAATGRRDACFMVLGTVPACRNRGVAGALLAHAVRIAAEQGYDSASVTVDSATPPGVPGLFAKAGFTPAMSYLRWACEA